MSYRVVIPTAGIGSRLEKLTKHLNKSLVSISHQPILSHIIEQFPKTCEFVIALGYKGTLVKDFLGMAYPDRIFYFVNVDPYEGKGSGLSYSLLCCKKYLQQPFVFTSCDTIVKEPIPNPNHNWMGYAYSKDLSPYRTIEVSAEHVIDIQEKGEDDSKDHQAYIGLAGVHDYLNFWEGMKKGKKTAIDRGETWGLIEVLKKNKIKSYKFTWLDTGNLKALAQANKTYKKINKLNILEKENESIWFVGDRVIKFSTDSQFIQNRFQRANKLKSFVPEILDNKKNMYCYNKVQGHVLSSIITLPLFNRLLEHCQKFWKKSELKFNEKKIFKKSCQDFYYDKTIKRIQLFYKNFDKKDGTESINNQKMPTLSSLLKSIDWQHLTNGYPVRFHGDLHFENILWQSKKKKFIFIDWRQDFSGNLEVGDIYYDLAKLLHGLIVSHDSIVKNYFSIEWNHRGISFDLQRKKILIDCEKKFNKWCIENNYSFSKVRILTALIYLNIAALHHYPYSLLLYTLGKFTLAEELKNTCH